MYYLHVLKQTKVGADNDDYHYFLLCRSKTDDLQKRTNFDPIKPPLPDIYYIYKMIWTLEL